MSFYFYISLYAFTLSAQNGVGHSETGVRMTYYGSDFKLVEGTREYTGDVPPFQPYGIGNCGLEHQPVDQKYFVAVNNNAYYKNSCGMCAKITYGGNCAVAPILDRCPGCPNGVDVSIQTFADLVGGEAKAREMGVANVNFEIVPCPSWRSSSGSPFTSDVDPCSGSRLTGSFRSSENKSDENKDTQQSTSTTTSTKTAVSTTSSTTTEKASTTTESKEVYTTTVVVTTKATSTTAPTTTPVSSKSKTTKVTKTCTSSTALSTSTSDNFYISSAYSTESISIWTMLLAALMI